MTLLPDLSLGWRDVTHSMQTRPPPIQPRTPTRDEIVERTITASFGSKLVTNMHRGPLVEAMVAFAIEPDWSWCSHDYNAWDFVHHSGLRLEVRQSAAWQSWSRPGSRPSRCSFDIRDRKGSYDQGTTWIEKAGRHAQIYLFAHHPLVGDAADHREPEQWRFYVVPAETLSGTATIGLAALQRLATACKYGALSEALDALMPTTR